MNIILMMILVSLRILVYWLFHGNEILDIAIMIENQICIDVVFDLYDVVAPNH